MQRRRVVVTGLGMVTPVGNNVEDTWRAILAGTSGVTTIDEFDTQDYPSKIAATVKDFDVTPYLSSKEARRVDPFIHYGTAAAVQAFEDSGLAVTEDNAARMGTAIGAGIGGINAIERNYVLLQKSSPRKISPFFIPGSVINMVAGNVSIRYGLKGPNISIVTACTTGTHNLGYAARTIAYGDADVMLAGGAEKGVSPLGIAGFVAARALSQANDDPVAASRPWDKDRDGFVMGDGAGMMVLEEYEHAKRRGANIYAELAGFGMSADAHHITAPPEDGSGARQAMQNALNDAEMNADDIQYINAHATSTILGDQAESAAISACFGGAAPKLAISSTKSMIGHLLGATGAVEAIFSTLAIRDQVAPPTINLDNPGEGCDLDYVPHHAREFPITATLSNSFGFGGTNGTLIFRKL